MDKYRKLLTELVRGKVGADRLSIPPISTTRYVADTDNDIYMYLSYGWENGKWHHAVYLHLDIIDGKIWLQQNLTEDSLVDWLWGNLIPKHDFVLGDAPEEARKMLAEEAKSYQQ